MSCLIAHAHMNNFIEQKDASVQYTKEQNIMLKFIQRTLYISSISSSLSSLHPLFSLRLLRLHQQRPLSVLQCGWRPPTGDELACRDQCHSLYRA